MQKAGAPYLLFLGDAQDELSIKGCTGVKIWRPEKARAQIVLEGGNQDLGLENMTPAQAAEAGCRTMVLGVANAGGFVPGNWIPTIIDALEAGLDVMAGMHKRLADIPAINEVAKQFGRTLFDVRQPSMDFKVGKGFKREGKRVITVGTDCSVGKKFTALALEKEMKGRGMKCTFRATGQSGIFIAGEGVAVDGVVADFIAGAAEWLSPDNEPDHWDVVEGQGSLFHPSFAGVSLGLLHGSQPDALVMCHEPTRPHMRGVPGRVLPSIEECIETNERMTQLTNPAAKVIGVSVNTSTMPEDEAKAYLEGISRRLGMPCSDSTRMGVGSIVDELEKI
ncbi:MAG: DUF1611 domain-containing protein [Rhodospirillales bacterium]|nr:DUF1611 domain-containing protein [Rhodospirillales bacterium]